MGNPVEVIKQFGMGYAVLGVLGVLTSLFMMLGSVMMMTAKSYKLSMATAILALIPCLQPCCILGLPAGIAALIVLMNADVKRAFE